MTVTRLTFGLLILILAASGTSGQEKPNEYSSIRKALDEGDCSEAVTKIDLYLAEHARSLKEHPEFRGSLIRQKQACEWYLQHELEGSVPQFMLKAIAENISAQDHDCKPLKDGKLECTVRLKGPLIRNHYVGLTEPNEPEKTKDLIGSWIRLF